ncbi:hypothetical protein BC829DRAFT_301528 [Chytridium lagenaria]|nr:hypothetical protein BC829DRAFT_301528 [Chytridium lagenaria]
MLYNPRRNILKGSRPVTPNYAPPIPIVVSSAAPVVTVAPYAPPPVVTSSKAPVVPSPTPDYAPPVTSSRAPVVPSSTPAYAPPIVSSKAPVIPTPAYAPPIVSSKAPVTPTPAYAPIVSSKAPVIPTPNSSLRPHCLLQSPSHPNPRIRPTSPKTHLLSSRHSSNSHQKTLPQNLNQSSSRHSSRV